MSERRYHHGDVQQEAIRFVREQLATAPDTSVSLRKIAAAIGVAHRALYNHFSDKEGLLKAVAAEGFTTLAQNIEPIDSVDALVTVYVDFALEHPALYDLMMTRANRDLMRDPILAPPLKRLIDQGLLIVAQEPDITNPQASLKTIWMLLHGAVGLHNNGVLADPSADAFKTSIRKLVANIIRKN